VIKQLLSILTNIEVEEIDYFEAVVLLNIDENMPLCSQAIFNLQMFHASFSDKSWILVLCFVVGRKALTFQQIIVIDQKLHLTTTCARKLECLVFFCSSIVSKNHLAVYSRE